jgi:hypothetical protein
MDLQNEVLDICYDRYKCEKMGLNYNNISYIDVKIKVLQERLKNSLMRIDGGIPILPQL